MECAHGCDSNTRWARNIYATNGRTKETPNEEIMFFKVTKFLTGQNVSLEGLNCTSDFAFTNGRHQVYIYIYIYDLMRLNSNVHPRKPVPARATRF